MKINTSSIINLVSRDEEQAKEMYEECVVLTAGEKELHITSFKEFYEGIERIDKEKYFELPKYLVYERWYKDNQVFWTITTPDSIVDMLRNIEEKTNNLNIADFVIIKDGKIELEHHK